LLSFPAAKSILRFIGVSLEACHLRPAPAIDRTVLSPISPQLAAMPPTPTKAATPNRFDVGQFFLLSAEADFQIEIERAQAHVEVRRDADRAMPMAFPWAAT
jgi:hypothetical protein